MSRGMKDEYRDEEKQMMPICKISLRFLEKWIHESRKSENINKEGKK